MADFSNLRNVRWTAEQIGSCLESGVPVSDRMFLQAIDELSPSLLSPWLMIALRRELDERVSRRGRPKAAAPTKTVLADHLRRVDRDDVPGIFCVRLAKRIKSGRRLTELARGAAAHRLSIRHRRDVTIYAVYRAIYDLLDGSTEIVHPIMGVIAVPTCVEQKHQQALIMTQEYLRGATALPVPSLDTMMNIITNNRP